MRVALEAPVVLVYSFELLQHSSCLGARHYNVSNLRSVFSKSDDLLKGAELRTEAVHASVLQ